MAIPRCQVGRSTNRESCCGASKPEAGRIATHCLSSEAMARCRNFVAPGSPRPQMVAVTSHRDTWTPPTRKVAFGVAPSGLGHKRSVLEGCRRVPKAVSEACRTLHRPSARSLQCASALTRRADGPGKTPFRIDDQQRPTAWTGLGRPPHVRTVRLAWQPGRHLFRRTPRSLRSGVLTLPVRPLRFEAPRSELLCTL